MNLHVYPVSIPTQWLTISSYLNHDNLTKKKPCKQICKLFSVIRLLVEVLVLLFWDCYVYIADKENEKLRDLWYAKVIILSVFKNQNLQHGWEETQMGDRRRYQDRNSWSHF